MDIIFRGHTLLNNAGLIIPNDRIFDIHGSIRINDASLLKLQKIKKRAPDLINSPDDDLNAFLKEIISRFILKSIFADYILNRITEPKAYFSPNPIFCVFGICFDENDFFVSLTPTGGLIVEYDFSNPNNPNVIISDRNYGIDLLSANSDIIINN